MSKVVTDYERIEFLCYALMNGGNVSFNVDDRNPSSGALICTGIQQRYSVPSQHVEATSLRGAIDVMIEMTGKRLAKE